VLSVGENTVVKSCVPAAKTVPATGLYMKLPGRLAVASSWVALIAVPAVMAAGVAQAIVGVAWFTASCTEAVAADYVVISVGVKVTESVCVPALSTVPATGVYAKVPPTLAVALNCVPLRAVPYVMGAGVLQAIVGTLVEPAGVMVTCVDALRFCGVTVAAAGDVPAGATSIYAACTVTVPAAFAVRAPLLKVAIEVLDSENWVPAVTSCDVPSLRWAMALRTDAPPTLIVEGLAVTVSESRLWDEGLLHPAMKIKMPHRSPEQTRARGEIRMNCLVSGEFEAARAGKVSHFKGANGLSHPRDTWYRRRNFVSCCSHYQR
jgi:hypothetical protein